MEYRLVSVSRFIVAVAFCLASCVATADVFTLLPFGRKGKMWGADSLGGAKLWTEPVEVNGVPLKMRVTLHKSTLREAFRLLKREFPKARFRSNAESILFEIPRLNGMVERIYLVAIKGKEFSTIQFSLELPKDMPKNPEWLNNLPIPGGAVPTETMVMSDRELEYGVFSTRMSPEAAMSEMTGQLIANGWTELQKGVFANKDKKRVMLLAASENYKGVTTGFVLARPLLGAKIK